MAILTNKIGRQNNRYPVTDVQAVNNSGAALVYGDVIVLDWTADGDANSALAPSTTLIITTYQKAVCIDPNGIAIGAVGNFRLQGPLPRVAIQANNAAFVKGDSLAMGGTVATGGTTLKALPINAAGATLNLEKAVGFVTSAIAGTIGTAASGQIVFDGSDCNGARIANP